MKMIVRNNWNPVADMVSMRDMVDRMFDSAYVSPFTFRDAAPAVDVTEDGKAFIVKAALPGWKPDQVDVLVENGVLTIKGTAEAEEENKDGGKVHWKEIRHSAFTRSFRLPEDVEADKVNAEFENGVLVLTLPKAEVVKPKQIKINVK